MKNYFLPFFFFFLVGALGAQTTIRGKVLDSDSGDPLIGATIVVKNTSVGAAADVSGSFEITTSLNLPLTLECYFLGYSTREVLLTSAEEGLVIRLRQSGFLADEVVVSASRKAEKITQTPSTINVITARQLEEMPTFNIGELIARQKGVDYVRAGVLGTGFNVRGFNSAFNPKNLQVNDNRLSSLIATGLPLGPLSTIVKEDIERVELILGPSATLYGPNANNGLVATVTKDPRTSQGTTVALGMGNQGLFTGRLRHAEQINDKFAYKISGEYTQGVEFDYVDTVYLGTDPRTAIAKEELELDRNFNSLRGEAALYYTPKQGHDLILSYGGSKSNNLAQTNAGRNQIKDWRVHYYQLRYTSPRVFAQAYYTQSRTDSTYAINQRTQNYWSFKNAGFSEEEALRRSYKEAWFGASPEAGIALNRGALFQDQSNRFNAELQYNNKIGNISYVVGSQYQLDQANSLGTYLLDNNGAGVNIGQIGGYLQAETTLDDKLKLVFGARGDYHELYGFNFIPKGALVYLLEEGSLRLTYGKGIAAPTILNLEGDLFGGLLLGNGRGFTVRDTDLSTGEFTETVINPLEVETIQTIEIGYKGIVKNKLFIDANAYYNISQNFLSPAINIAGGAPAGTARTVVKRGDELMSNVVPGTPESGSAFVLTYLNFGQVNTYGFDLGLTYSLNSRVNLVANYSYFDFTLDEEDPSNDGNRDGLVNALDLPINTPNHKASFAFNYSDKKFFGSILTRWVQAYDFFSGINVAARGSSDIFLNLPAVPALGLEAERYELAENARFGRTFNNGPLGGFVNVDVSMGYRINEKITLGGQVVNVFNNTNVREFVASPFIGRLYQLELKVNLPGYVKK